MLVFSVKAAMCVQVMNTLESIMYRRNLRNEVSHVVMKAMKNVARKERYLECTCRERYLRLTSFRDSFFKQRQRHKFVQVYIRQ